ncbi:hypothetical protein CEXT_775051 [Caerostris extrusa]|uniref:Uncharacterized protein n=1 Tax=Caerostris extrusa TaxID=172846 RepID=A0AAV4N7B0_CAEEX|nr:hypothetical protein CEXT_775051 [Caerostris extrusa]
MKNGKIFPPDHPRFNSRWSDHLIRRILTTPGGSQFENNCDGVEWSTPCSLPAGRGAVCGAISCEADCR